MVRLKRVGQSEMKVLNHISLNGEMSVREVADFFAKDGIARTTVLTMMERLREKGFLSRKKKKGHYVYYSKKTKSELLKKFISEFIENTLGGKISPFLMYLQKNADQLSERDLEELKQFVEDQQNKRGSNDE